MTPTETVERVNVRDFASAAWAEKAQILQKIAIESLYHQMHVKLKVKRSEIEVVPDYFPEMVEPYLAIAAHMDGLVFCLERDSRSLAVVSWRCDDKKCSKIARSKVDDYISLGRALALGDAYQAVTPKCEAHR